MMLTERRERILEWVRGYVWEHGRPPSIREIGAGVGISSTSVVVNHLRVLEEEGYIRREGETSRGLEIVSDRVMRERLVSVPIRGRIAAGEPTEALEMSGEILLTEDLAPAGAYALEVKGYSMIGDCIDDGDLVVIRPQVDAENGETVVALLTSERTDRGEVTLKRFYREKEMIRLEPRNPALSPIRVKPEDIQVQGTVVSVIRRVK